MDHQTEITPVNQEEFLSAVYGGRDMGLAQPFDREIFLLQTHIAGARYREGYPGIIRRLKLGTLLTLVREPENPYDELAIRVLDDKGAWIGYVPMERNPPLARLMDAGKYLYGKVAKKEKWNGEPDARFDIFMRDLAPISLKPDTVSGPKPEPAVFPDHPVRIVNMQYRAILNWFNGLRAICEFQTAVDFFHEENLFEIFVHDLAVHLMALLATDVQYRVEDAAAGYALVRHYLTEYEMTLPDKLDDLRFPVRAINALMQGFESGLPECAKITETIDRIMLKDKSPEKVNNSYIFRFLSAYMIIGTNFLSIYNHSEEGSRAQRKSLAVLQDKLDEYRGEHTDISEENVGQIREDNLYVGVDGLKGWLHRDA